MEKEGSAIKGGHVATFLIIICAQNNCEKVFTGIVKQGGKVLNIRWIERSGTLNQRL